MVPLLAEAGLDRLKQLERWKERKTLEKEKSKREKELKDVFRTGVYHPKDTFNCVALPPVPKSKARPKEVGDGSGPRGSYRCVDTGHILSGFGLCYSSSGKVVCVPVSLLKIEDCTNRKKNCCPSIHSFVDSVLSSGCGQREPALQSHPVGETSAAASEGT